MQRMKAADKNSPPDFTTYAESNRVAFLPAAIAAVFLFGQAMSVAAAFSQDVRNTPDELLWISIQQMESGPSLAADTPYEARIHTVIAGKEQLAERLRSYQRLYPGGAHFASAAQRELEILFDLATLSGDFSRLTARIAEIDSKPPSETIHAAAAWWQLQLKFLDERDKVPSRSSLADRDARRVKEMAAFARRFPTSPLAVRAASLAGEDCLRRADFECAREWVGWMNANAAATPPAIRLAGLLRRAEAIGVPLTGRLTSIDGVPIDLASFRRGRAVVIFWNSRHKDSRKLASELQARCAARQITNVVGIDLSDSVDETRRISASLGLTWPQVNDRRGLGGGIVREWGITDTPAIMVTDATGNISTIVDRFGSADSIEQLLSDAALQLQSSATQPAKPSVPSENP